MKRARRQEDEPSTRVCWRMRSKSKSTAMTRKTVNAERQKVGNHGIYYAEECEGSFGHIFTTQCFQVSQSRGTHCRETCLRPCRQRSLVLEKGRLGKVHRAK